MPNIRVTPVIGLPQFNGWSQVVESPPHSSVRTILSIAIEGTHAGNVGRDIANYFSSQVVQTLEEFHLVLEEVIAQATENEVRVLCSAGFFSTQSCAYATFNGAILLKRGEKVGAVLSSGNQLKLIAGTYTPQDVVVFSTLSASHFFSEIEQKFEQGFDADTIVTSIVPGLHAQGNSSLSALAFVSFVERSSSVVLAQTETEEGEDEDEEYDTEVVPPVQEKATNSSSSDPKEKYSTEPIAEVATQLAASLEEPLATKTKRGTVSVQRTTMMWVLQFLKRIASFIVKIVRQLGMSIKLLSMFIWQKSTVLFTKGKKQLADRPSLSSLLPGKDVYIQAANHTYKKNIRNVVVVLTICIVAGVIGFLVVSKRTAERESAREALAPFVTQAELAQQQVGDDPVAARNQLQSVLNGLDVLLQEHAEEKLFVAEVVAQKERFSKVYEDISGLDEVQELPIFYDLRLVSSDFVASKVVAIDTNFYFFDLEQKTLVQLTSTNKKVSKYELDVEKAIEVASFEDGVLLLGEGVSLVKIGEDGVAVNEVITAGDSNRSASLIASYETYVYVVNPEKRNIYRYAENDGDFSEPIGWVQEVARGLDFKDIVSIAVDGDVWLGTKTGQLFKFTRGKVQDFTINGLNTAFESALQVHTTVDSERLYILEA